MNTDPQFSDAFPRNETARDDGTYVFSLTARYVPQAAEVAR
jgi:hypothetical protein